MIGIYLLVTLFSQFAPQSIWPVSAGEPVQLTVAFSSADGVQQGSPVLIEGQLVGSVVRVSPCGSVARRVNISNSTNSDSQCGVDIKVGSRHRTLLVEGTVGLIATPLTVSRSTPEIVVELLVPRKSDSGLLAEGAQIPGFSSFEDLWASGASDKLAADSAQPTPNPTLRSPAA